MGEWHEFRLWYGMNHNPNDLFTFKKTRLLLTLERNNVGNFLMLDEPKFILIRIDVDIESAKRIHSELENIIKPIFSKVTRESWSPTEDAGNRILSASTKLPAVIPEAVIPEGGWMIRGKTADGKWSVAPENFDRQREAFSIFMTKVVGKFTKAYLKEMPFRVEDRWLMSLFVHLLLDSISTCQIEEKEIRQFPYI